MPGGREPTKPYHMSESLVRYSCARCRSEENHFDYHAIQTVFFCVFGKGRIRDLELHTVVTKFGGKCKKNRRLITTNRYPQFMLLLHFRKQMFRQ